MMVAMTLAVCLLFTPEADVRVRQLWGRLEARGVPTLLTHTHRRHSPHLSLAVARTWDLQEVVAALEPIPEGAPLTLSLPGIVAFTRERASLAVGVDADLARRQQAVAEGLVRTGADLHRHYEPGKWVPHVSLTTGGSAAQLPVISNLINDALPLTLQVASAALIDTSTGTTWPLPRLL